MLNWFEIRNGLSKEYIHLSEYGFELERLVDDFIYTVSNPAGRSMKNGILTTFMDLPKLARLKILIDAQLTRILQQLVMMTFNSEKDRKDLIDDLQNFKKWIASYEKDMKFKEMRDPAEFVNYIAILNSFLESYFYDALLHHIKTNQPLAEILVARAGVIVQPASWAKEMLEAGRKLESKT